MKSTVSIDESLTLKPIKELDAPQIFSLIENNRAHLKEFLGWLDYNQSEEDSIDFVRAEMKKSASGEAITFGIHYSDTLVGLVSIYDMDTLNGIGSLGYWIAKEYEGKGIVKRSVQGLIEYVFKEKILRRIEVRCAIHNERSLFLIEKLGFKKEGLLKEAIAHYGTYFDAYLFALLQQSI